MNGRPLDPLSLIGAAIGLLAATVGSAQVPGSAFLVRDIAAVEDGSSPSEAASFGDVVYFRAARPDVGLELWRSDGTPAGTVLAHDLRPGPASSVPEGLVVWGDRLVLRADDGVHGAEPWIVDRSGAPARLLADLDPGPSSSLPEHFTPFGPRLVFTASIDGRRQIVVSDGTESGTAILPGLEPPLSFGGFVVLGGRVAFSADDGATGFEPWISDGTPAGSRLLADLVPGPGSSYPGGWARVAGGVAFSATDGETGVLWWSDGSVVRRLSPPGQRVRALELGVVAAAGQVFYLVEEVDGAGVVGPGGAGGPGRVAGAAGEGGEGDLGVLAVGSAAGWTVGAEPGFGESADPAIGIGLWRVAVDGSGPERILRVAERIDQGPTFLVAAGGRAHLDVRSPEVGHELAVVDAVTGAVEITDAAPGPRSAAPRAVLACADGIALSLDDGESGRELWRHDGMGLRQVADLAPGIYSSDPVPLAELDGGLFVAADDGVLGREPWLVDEAGPRLLADLVAGATADAHFDGRGVTLADGRLAFVVDDRIRGHEPWVTDGTFAGTEPIADLRSGSAGSAPREPVALGAGLVLVADDGLHGEEPWASDGTGEGTILLADLVAGPVGSRPRGLVRVGERIFFVTGGAGAGIGSSDGTASGTRIHGDLPPLVGEPGGAVALAGEYVIGVAEIRGATPVGALWISDGTAAGTRRLVEGIPVYVGRFGTFVEVLTAATVDRLFFTRSDDGSGESGTTLWVSDGGPEPPHPVFAPGSDPGPGSPGSIFALEALDRRAVFATDDPDDGITLWGSDGRAGGTELLARGRFVAHVGRLGDRLVLGFDDGLHGAEPWITDGTASGTRRIAELAPGISSSYPRPGVAVAGQLFFSPAGGPLADSLVATDGSVSGTVVLAGPPLGQPPVRQVLGAGRDFVAFVGDDEVHGTELWILPLGAGGPNTVPLGPSGRFSAWMTWRDATGRTGVGRPGPGTEASGSFWFFEPSNLEVTVKVLDGHRLNGCWWVFWASMTDIAFELTVRDQSSGAEWSIENPLGHFASGGDVEAFCGP